jgi:plastocyanin
MRRFVVVVLAPVLVFVAAGCGSSSDSSSTKSSTPAAPTTGAAATPATPAPGAVAIGVRETEYKLTPADISPKKSGNHTILAMNQGKITHAIEVEGGGAGGKDVRSADIAPGQAATITVDLTAGKTYTWYCPIDGHKALGMKGTIKVAGAAGSSSAGTPQTTTGGSSGASSGGASKGAY